jgi:hypothetical protein
MPSYKYNNVYEWFCEYIDRHPEEAIAIAKELALKAGGDTIQDMFQSKMTEDGYFKKKVHARRVHRKTGISYQADGLL